MLRFVPTPIGNIADISLRTLDVLSKAEVFLCEDTRVTKQLLKILQERYQLILQPHRVFYALHSHNETEFLQNISPEFFTKEVVYVSDAGMPCISDPGAMLVAYAQKNNIDYDVLPGANALLSAYSASGFAQSRFVFYGFLPHKTTQRTKELGEILTCKYNVVVYESPHRMEKLLKELDKLSPQREIFCAKELTKKYQSYYKGNASAVLEKIDGTFKGEWVVVIKAAPQEAKNLTLTQADIEQLDLPKKQKAKLLSKITGKSIKEIYNEMVY